MRVLADGECCLGLCVVPPGTHSDGETECWSVWDLSFDEFWCQSFHLAYHGRPSRGEPEPLEHSPDRERYYALTPEQRDLLITAAAVLPNRPAWNRVVRDAIQRWALEEVTVPEQLKGPDDA